MEKNKAIQLLERLQDPEPYEPMLTKDAYDAIQMAIDALSADGDTISRKAAIDAINHELRCGAVIDQCGLETAHDLIKELPPAQLGTNLAEVGTDCISRQDALEAFGLSEKTRKYGGDHSGYDTMMMYEIQDTIEDLPPIQPRRGKWIKLDMHRGMADHKCTACEQECYVPTCMGEPMYAFCPNCGAEMREVTT